VQTATRRSNVHEVSRSDQRDRQGWGGADAVPPSGAALTSTRRGADQTITSAIDRHVQAEQRGDDDDGAAGALVPVG
jgi:hypothetical protein